MKSNILWGYRVGGISNMIYSCYVRSPPYLLLSRQFFWIHFLPLYKDVFLVNVILFGRTNCWAQNLLHWLGQQRRRQRLQGLLFHLYGAIRSCGPTLAPETGPAGAEGAGRCIGRVSRESRAERQLCSHRATELCLMSDAASRCHAAHEWGHCVSPEMCVSLEQRATVWN